MNYSLKNDLVGRGFTEDVFCEETLNRKERRMYNKIKRKMEINETLKKHMEPPRKNAR